jgi:hypothetical protein
MEKNTDAIRTIYRHEGRLCPMHDVFKIAFLNIKFKIFIALLRFVKWTFESWTGKLEVYWLPFEHPVRQSLIKERIDADARHLELCDLTSALGIFDDNDWPGIDPRFFDEA